MEGERQEANETFHQLERPTKALCIVLYVAFLLKEFNGGRGMENCGSDLTPRSTSVTFESISTEAPDQFQKGEIHFRGELTGSENRDSCPLDVSTGEDIL